MGNVRREESQKEVSYLILWRSQTFKILLHLLDRFLEGITKPQLYWNINHIIFERIVFQRLFLNSDTCRHNHLNLWRDSEGRMLKKSGWVEEKGVGYEGEAVVINCALDIFLFAVSLYIA
jgi:hypothetical protein